MMGNWDGYGMVYGNQWGSIFGFIFMMIIMAAIVVGAVVLLRRSSHGNAPASGSETSALELLNQRYAKGEIKQDEYRAIKKDLDL
jgi:putative membrane protein